MTSRKEQVSLSLSRDLLTLIDQERGLATRSAWIERVLRERYEEASGTKGTGSPLPMDMKKSGTRAKWLT